MNKTFRELVSEELGRIKPLVTLDKLHGCAKISLAEKRLWDSIMSGASDEGFIYLLSSIAAAAQQTAEDLGYVKKEEQSDELKAAKEEILRLKLKLCKLKAKLQHTQGYQIGKPLARIELSQQEVLELLFNG
jgi:hypothetical protein